MNIATSHNTGQRNHHVELMRFLWGLAGEGVEGGHTSTMVATLQNHSGILHRSAGFNAAETRATLSRKAP